MLRTIRACYAVSRPCPKGRLFAVVVRTGCKGTPPSLPYDTYVHGFT